MISVCRLISGGHIVLSVSVWDRYEYKRGGEILINIQQNLEPKLGSTFELLV